MVGNRDTEDVLVRAEQLRARVFLHSAPDRSASGAAAVSGAAAASRAGETGVSSNVGRRLVGALDLQDLFGDEAVGESSAAGAARTGAAERRVRSLAPALQDVRDAEELADYVLAANVLENNPPLQIKYKDQQAVYPPVVGPLLAIYGTIDPSVRPPSQAEQLRAPFFRDISGGAILEPGVTPADRRTRTQVAKILLDADIARGTRARTAVASTFPQGPSPSALVKRAAEIEPSSLPAAAKKARYDEEKRAKKLKKQEKKRLKQERRLEKERRRAQG